MAARSRGHIYDGLTATGLMVRMFRASPFSDFQDYQ